MIKTKTIICFGFGFDFYDVLILVLVSMNGIFNRFLVSVNGIFNRFFSGFRIWFRVRSPSLPYTCFIFFIGLLLAQFYIRICHFSSLLPSLSLTFEFLIQMIDETEKVYSNFIIILFIFVYHLN